MFSTKNILGFQLEKEIDDIRGKWLVSSTSLDDFIDESEHASMPELLNDDQNEDIDEEDSEEELDEIYEDIHNGKCSLFLCSINLF